MEDRPQAPAGEARPQKARLDVVLVERGLAASRERARSLILAGRVLVREQKIDKPGTSVAADSPIRLLGGDNPYVSRGGLKLAAALGHWQIDVTGRACLDVGASTGGFTDCLLQHGAAQVTAVDTGFGQIDMKLRNDPRVRLLERTNARLLEPGSLATHDPGEGSNASRRRRLLHFGDACASGCSGRGAKPGGGGDSRQASV